MSTGGRIPREFVDQLLSRIDIVEVVGARVPLKKAGREYQACCPFHNEKTPSFTVSPTKQFYHCFGCGAHGSAITFLMEYDHLEYPEAVEALARMAGMAVPRSGGDDNTPRKPRDASLYVLLEEAATWYQKQLQSSMAARQYLAQRGLEEGIIQRFGLGYAPAGISLARQLAHFGKDKLLASGMALEDDNKRVYDRFRDRVMFPIRDRQGRVIGFGGRVIGNGTPKYLNSPETSIFHKGRELYGLFEARQHTRKFTRLLVVEGYMDVIALAQYGITYAVATLGTATTPEHIKQLLRLVPEVVFCFDGDRAGRDAAWRAVENALPELRDDKAIRFLFLPQGEDPDTYVRRIGSDGFTDLLDEAMPLSRYLLARLKEQYNPSTAEGKARLLDAGLALLGNMPAILLREQLLAELAKLSDTPLEMVRRHLQKKTAQPATSAYTPQAYRNQQDVRRTPVRHAIALLLHYPQLARLVENPEQLPHYDLPGVALLAKLVEMIEEHPHIRLAGLVESFRHSEYAEAINRLSQWQPEHEDATLLEREFSDCLQQVRRQARQKRLEALLHREQMQALTEQERHDLTELLIQEYRSPRQGRSG